MKKSLNSYLLWAMALLFVPLTASATIDGSLDPESVVSEWSNSSTYPKIIDINFSDEMWPGKTWTGETAKDCPEYDGGGFVNAVIEVPANGGTAVTYPVVFHSCTFANKTSYNGRAGTTAAFARQYYLGESCAGKTAENYNNWTVAGHTKYIEDNITYDSDGYPNYGEAGFVQMCRTKNSSGSTNAEKKSNLGWVEIDHIPYVDRIQWAWSNTSWGRGIKCDVKIGDGDWEPLVWMCDNQHEKGYTMFSDQGYFMENEINDSDVSIRWRVWDGERIKNPVQTDANGKGITTEYCAKIDGTDLLLTWYQAARLHKVQIFGSEITSEQAQYARDNQVNDPGELTDLDKIGGEEAEGTAPDDGAPVVIYTVAQDGSGDYTTVQEAVNAVPDKTRGIIYIRKGTYAEQLNIGTKDSHNKWISLIGEDRDNVIITSDAYMSDGSDVTYDQTSAMNVYTDCFHAEDITFQNTSKTNHSDAGQALAVYTNGDAHTFTNCTLKGYQDTYKANSGNRGYFKSCIIEGATDFIYDSGLEWFEDCEIRSIGGGYITAPGKSDLTFTKALYSKLSQSKMCFGLLFNNCRITAADGVADNSVYLGRTWDNNGGAMFMNCTLGNHIKAEGWTGMGDTDVTTCTNAEYQNKDTSGNLVDTSSRASWSFQATEEEVNEYVLPYYLFKKHTKDVPFNYTSILAGAGAPDDITVDGSTFSWDAEDPAPGYIIYKDGEFYKIITETTFTVEDDAKYTVASISSQGVVSDAVKLKATEALIAFPTAEGFGKFASGGRGGHVVTVTNLEDDVDNPPTGSLRWALNQYPDEPITVVFNVSGWIILKDVLQTKRSAGLTIAGQTAPGEGITLYPRMFSINGAKNVIVRNIRVRCGSKSYNGNDLIKDAEKVDQALCAENAENVIFDHCTFGWSAEEILNNQTTHYQTYSYCLLHEGLYDAGHHKGSARSFAAQWGGSQTTMHHNMIAHCASRSPRFQGARDTDYMVYDEYVNNVNFNWGNWGACYGGENNQTGRYSSHEINFCNNYYRQGPATKKNISTSNLKFIRATAGSRVSNWHLSGNYMDGNTDITADNSKGFTVDGDTAMAVLQDEFIVPQKFFVNYEFDWATYTMKDKMQTAEEAYNDVLNNVGCITRDEIEQRIINECKNGTSTYGGSWKSDGNYGIIDDPSDAEIVVNEDGTTYCSTAKASETRPDGWDTDGDGMPDSWETAHGLNPNVADNNSLNDDGYTALEVYINSLMGETMDENFTSGIHTATAETVNTSNARYNLAGQRVGANFKGIVIQNGKKYLKK